MVLAQTKIEVVKAMLKMDSVNPTLTGWKKIVPSLANFALAIIVQTRVVTALVMRKKDIASHT